MFGHASTVWQCGRHSNVTQRYSRGFYACPKPLRMQLICHIYLLFADTALNYLFVGSMLCLYNQNKCSTMVWTLEVILSVIDKNVWERELLGFKPKTKALVWEWELLWKKPVCE